VRWQRALARRGGRPVLDLSLFRVSSYVAGVVAIAAFMVYFAGFMFTLALLLQGGLGLTAFEAGLAFAPMGCCTRPPRWPAPGWSAATGCGCRSPAARSPARDCSCWRYGSSGTRATQGCPWVMTGMTLVGSGNGLVLPQLIQVALVQVRADQAGAGSAILTTAQQFAGAAGVAVSGAVFFAVLGSGAGGAGHGRAMGSAAVLYLVLIAVVTGLVAVNGHLARRAERT
jgi:hypothetical protein